MYSRFITACAIMLTSTGSVDFGEINVTIILIDMECIEIPIMDDILLEEDETFQICISDSAVQVDIGEAVVTIVDDESELQY